MMVDSARELRSMNMVLFACPPVTFVTNEGRRSNSHDLIAALLNVEMRRENAADNRRREAEQKKLEEHFFETHVSDLQEHLQMFTRRWMMLYNKAAADVVFVPLDATPPKVLRQVCSWLAAQYILLGQERKAEEFEHWAPLQLYTHCFEVKRLWWAMKK